MNVEVLKASRAKDVHNEIIEVAKSLDDNATEMVVLTTDEKLATRCIQEKIPVNWRKA